MNAFFAVLLIILFGSICVSSQASSAEVTSSYIVVKKL